MTNQMLNQQVFKVEESLIRKFSTYAAEQNAKWVLTLGEPDFPTPDPIKQACIDALHQDKTKYGITPGNLDFRKKIAAFEKSLNQIDYSPNEITVTNGATESVTVALMTMLNPGDEVIILTPAYPLYKNITTFSRGVIVPIDTSDNHFQVTSEMLAQAVTEKTKAIVVTSPNNPTGSILTDASLEAIYQSAKEHGYFIISDECYNQLVYDERLLGISKYQDIRDQIVICQSFSKPYAMPGWRLGYLMASEAFTAHARKVHQYLVTSVNNFIQDAGIAALDYDPREMTESYRLRRDYTFGRLKEMGLELELPAGAFYLFPSIKKYHLDSWTFCERLVKEHQVALVPGVCFEAEGFVRISYCVGMDVLENALDRLALFLKKIEEA